MPKSILAVTIALVLTVLFLGGVQVTQGQAPPGEQVISHEEQNGNVREITAPAGDVQSAALNIGFIDSPSIVCYQPDATEDACYVNWYQINVSASPNFMFFMTVTLASKITERVHGFFQTSMNVPYSMVDRGFKVACGEPGAGGLPELGNAYDWEISAIDSASTKASNQGRVYCPAYQP